MTLRAFAGVALLMALALWTAPAAARVERFAILIGNNRGDPGEPALRYAGSDAARLYEVLRDLGSFEPYNMVLLREEKAATVRSTLLTINERVREALSRPDTDVLLLVYYSGHADAEALHLSGTRLPLTELSQLVRGSAASFRLLVLDACRSGSVTRLKGGKRVEPFELPDARLPSDGLAFLTASSANEDAQESDELKASFFTHALTSGLLGAADHDQDGAVSLAEAYRFAYDATLRSTSRTLAGTQHPTFRFEFRGSGDLILTQPAARAAERARLLFPAGVGVLLMRGDAEGTVTAELSPSSAQRGLSLRPGRYFVRARGRDVLYEGHVDARAGTSAQVELATLERIEYARLVRKGQRPSQLAHGPELGLRVRSPLPNEARPCAGGFVGYAVDFERIGLRARVSGCGSGFDNAVIEASSSAFDLELGLYHAWDLAAVAAELGLGAGLSLFTQRFETLGEAPARSSLAPYLALGARASVDLGQGFGLGLDLAGETHFIPLVDRAHESSRTSVAFAVRPGLALSKRF